MSTYTLTQIEAGEGGGGVHRTSIEWCDYALGGLVRARDPETGKVLNMCVPVSEGCRHCYASTSTGRFHRRTYSAQNAKALEWFWDEDAARSVMNFRPRGPFKGGRSRPTLFLGDMTDPFGAWVTDEWLDRMFALCALRPDVDFQILTKRPERMAEYLHRITPPKWLLDYPRGHEQEGKAFLPHPWPLPNVWLGTSVERQQEADARIPHLLRCPAAVRFLSCEPLLGPVDLTEITDGPDGGSGWTYRHWNALTNENWCDCQDVISPADTNAVNWVIVGGESGPGACRCDVAWIRGIVNQCKDAGVPRFVKQVGSRPMVGDLHDGIGWTEVGARVDYEHETGRIALRDRKGGDPAEWPEDLRVRQWPEVSGVFNTQEAKA